MADVHVRDVSARDGAVWSDLWEQYLRFYEADLPAGHAESLWRRVVDEDDPTVCLVAEVDGNVVGMAQFFPHGDTWGDRLVCYLQDLYVDPAWRGRGVGASLIRSVQARCRDRGWAYVYWLTAEDNDRARHLYDSLTGGANGFVVYELGVDEAIGEMSGTGGAAT